MSRRPPRSTRTAPLFPDTTLYRSNRRGRGSGRAQMPPFHFVQHRLFEPGRMLGIADPAEDGEELLVRQLGSIGGVLQIIVHGESPHRRSEEHTSELQSLMRISNAVFCLKKKNRRNTSLMLSY